MLKTKTMKKLFILYSFCSLCFSVAYSQAKIYKHYVYLGNYTQAPTFTTTNGLLVYNGKKAAEATFFSGKNLTVFETAFPDAIDLSVKNVFYLETTSTTLVTNMKTTFPTLYINSDDLTDIVITNLTDYYPNDYGSSSPNPNFGYNFNRKEWDYLHVPKAWGITTGNPSIKIGICDTPIYSLDQEFTGKLEQIDGQFPSVFAPTPSNWNQSGDAFHGTDVAATAAARGNNSFGSAGVCMDCSIVSSTSRIVYGANYPVNVVYSNLYKMAIKGAKVINMSWLEGTIGYTNNPNAGIPAHQFVINELVSRYRITLVGAAGNRPSGGILNCSAYGYPYGMLYVYPASYDNVISVSTVGHKNPLQLPLTTSSPSYESTSPLYPIFMEIEDSFSSWISALDPNYPIGIDISGYNISSFNQCGFLSNLTSNDKVDILAPGVGVYGHVAFLNPNTQSQYYGLTGGTSFSAPTVSGTIGLMLSLNDCLLPSEIEDIIQLSAKDVENMPINQNYYGNLGAGKLEVGNSVEFTDEMKKATGTAVIKNHVYPRFDFNLSKINNNLSIDNVTFKDNCKANFKARTQIRLLPGTNLKPNATGNTYLGIDPAIVTTCTPVVFPTSARTTNNNSSATSTNKVVLYPNPNNGTFNLLNINEQDFGTEAILLQIFDINGRSLYTKTLKEDDFANCEINLSDFASGIYIVKITSAVHSQDIKFVKK